MKTVTLILPLEAMTVNNLSNRSGVTLILPLEATTMNIKVTAVKLQQD